MPGYLEHRAEFNDAAGPDYVLLTGSLWSLSQPMMDAEYLVVHGYDVYIAAYVRYNYFGYQRTPTNLYVRYRPWVSAALSIPRFARQWVGRLVPQYASLCALDDARRRTAS